MSFKSNLKKDGTTFRRWIIKHTLLAGAFGAGVFIILYYNILNIRTKLPGGYFSSPGLTTTSEITWFIMGIFLYLLIAGIRGYFKHRQGRVKR